MSVDFREIKREKIWLYQGQSTRNGLVVLATRFVKEKHFWEVFFYLEKTREDGRLTVLPNSTKPVYHPYE